MSTKTLNTRVQLKHDTKANWDKATNFSPLAGEIIIYDDTKQIKVGDGTTNVINLPFYTYPVVISSSKPASPVAGTLWISTSSSNYSCAVYNGGSWIELGDAWLFKSGTTDPTESVSNPTIYRNTTTNTLFFSNNVPGLGTTHWTQIGGLEVLNGPASSLPSTPTKPTVYIASENGVYKSLWFHGGYPQTNWREIGNGTWVEGTSDPTSTGVYTTTYYLNAATNELWYHPGSQPGSDGGTSMMQWYKISVNLSNYFECINGTDGDAPVGGTSNASIYHTNSTNRYFIKAAGSTNWSELAKISDIPSVPEENNYDLIDQYGRWYAGSNAIYSYKLCVEGENGRLLPLALTSGTGTSHTTQTAGFYPNKIYFYNNTTTVNANALVPAQKVYYAAGITQCNYTFNSTIATYNKVYLKGHYNPNTGLFTLDTTGVAGTTSWYVSVPTNTSFTQLSNYFTTGYDYLLVGRTYSTANYMYILPWREVETFNGVGLVPYTVAQIGNINNVLANLVEVV